MKGFWAGANMANKPEMMPSEALKCIFEIEKLLISKRIWYKITEINEPNLKFVHIEASIKVKQ